MVTGNPFDVIIIGTGAGGGTLAYALAPTGKRILLIERGDYVPREKDNWDSRAVNVQGKYQTKEVWYDKDGKPLHPHTNYYVGGNTKFYGAALFRAKARREDNAGEKSCGLFFVEFVRRLLPPMFRHSRLSASIFLKYSPRAVLNASGLDCEFLLSISRQFSRTCSRQTPMAWPSPMVRPNFLTVYSNLPGEYSSIVATAIELKWYSDTGNP
jgi:hypothetical protein